MTEQGFTMLEMLVAMAILAMVAVLSFLTLNQAGDGFRLLSEYAGATERAQWVNRQLRADVHSFALSQDRDVKAFGIAGSDEGDGQFWMLIRDMNSPTLMQVRYFVRGESRMLVRQTVSPWARDTASAMEWEMIRVDSFDARLLDRDGNLHRQWMWEENEFPEAVRVQWSAAGEAHELLLPFSLDKEMPR